MSGQPVKTQAEKNKKRNEYLESLALQEQINDMNLQANKNYLLTGQLPPQSQMQDTRTTTEKLKDIELMKQKIVGDFAGTISAQAVHALIQKIIDSPLNLNNSLFRFFAQRATSIAEQFKKQYSVGIEGDANDIERIYEYVKNMYSDTQGKFQTTKSYMNSMSSGSSSSKIIGGNDLDVVITQIEDIIKNIQFTTQRGVNKGGIPDTGRILRTLMGKILELKQTLPSTNEMSILMNEFNNPVGNIDTEKRRIYEAYFTLIEKLPKYNEVSSLITKINQYIASNNLETAGDGIKRLKNMFGILYDKQNIKIMEEFNNSYKQPLEQQLNAERQLNDIQRISDIESIEKQNRLASKAQKVYVINPESDPVWVRNPSLLNSNQQPYDNLSRELEYFDKNFKMPDIPSTVENPKQYLYYPPYINDWDNYSNDSLKTDDLVKKLSDELDNYSNDSFSNSNRTIDNLVKKLNGSNDNNTNDNSQKTDNLRNELDYLYNTIVENKQWDNLIRVRTIKFIRNVENLLYPKKFSKNINPNDVLTYIDALEEINDELENMSEISSNMSDLSSVGYGLKRGRGRPQGYRKMKGGSIQEPKEDLRKKANFVGFGINEIHQKQLDKGLVKIRRSTKSNYMDMPTRRVSTNLQGILKTIVGGGVPNYNDLGKLDEEEKIYLNKLISRSELTDRISVPAPSKDQQEKDIHNFEVMRGQIMSGNDSQELVKQFKLLIRKLMKQGLLPKADVEDLLTTLIDLGY